MTSSITIPPGLRITLVGSGERTIIDGIDRRDIHFIILSLISTTLSFVGVMQINRLKGY